MPGKNPHRPEGKADADNEHMQARWMSKGLPHQAPSQMDVHARDLEAMRRGGGPSRTPAEESIGGSRPGVESRVKEAIETREAREEDEA